MACYHVNAEHTVVLLRPTGRFTEDDLVDLIQTVLTDPRRRPAFNHVWDTRDIDELVMDADVIPMYRTLLDKKADRIAQEKVAIVATRPLTRTFSAMLAQVSRRHPAAFQLFETLEAAAGWVGVPAPVLIDVPDDDWTRV
jgi:hypothetical protein